MSDVSLPRILKVRAERTRTNRFRVRSYTSWFALVGLIGLWAVLSGLAYRVDPALGALLFLVLSAGTMITAMLQAATGDGPGVGVQLRVGLDGLRTPDGFTRFSDLVDVAVDDEEGRFVMLRTSKAPQVMLEFASARAARSFLRALEERRRGRSEGAAHAAYRHGPKVRVADVLDGSRAVDELASEELRAFERVRPFLVGSYGED